MYSKIISFFLNHFFSISLILICLFIIFINHTPNTILSGWDTLHPEFDFSLSFKRILFGVFRNEQGLGTVAAHAHIAELPRVILLKLASLVIPLNLLRYSFISASLLVGVLGTYFFIQRLLTFDVEVKYKKVFAFLGSLFYLLNLGTLQHFYVPFEMFVVQYAFLPWLFLQALNYLKTNDNRALVFFAITTFISAPMAFASMLWFAYLLSLILFLIPFIKKNLKKVSILIISTLVMNSFWLLPNLYFLLSGNASYVPEAKINKIFSEEAFAYNKSYGNLVDTAIFKNFLFDWTAYQGGDRFGYLMEGWRTHLEKPGIIYVGYLSFLVVFLGIINIIRKKYSVSYSLIFPALAALIFIVNLNPPFEFIFGFLRENFSLFREALRLPFTKFSIILIFFFSCFFAFGQYWIYTKISKLKYFLGIQTIATCILLVIYMLPVFQGDFISKHMQIIIPQEYFQTFSYFNSKPADAKIALLPVHSFWGWVYYNWGFQGAQFLSFGIKQPILDRDYDRWNPMNEGYFREISYAIYSKDRNLVESVLKKYNTKYLILDKNILAPGINQDKKILFFNEIESMFLEEQSRIKQVNKFGNILIYEFENNQNVINTPDSFITYSNPPKSKDIDWTYLNMGEYISHQNLKNDYFYPYLDLYNNLNLANNEVLNIKEKELKISNRNLVDTYPLPLEKYLNAETTIPASFFAKKINNQIQIKLTLNLVNDLEQSIYLEYDVEDLPQDNEGILINIDQNQTLKLENLNEEYRFIETIFLSTVTPNNLVFYSSNSESQKNNLINNFTIPNPKVQLCGYEYYDQFYNVYTSRDSMTLLGRNANVCFWYPMNSIIKPEELEQLTNLINFNFNIHTSGKSLGHYCIFDKNLKRCIKEESYIQDNSKINTFLPLDPDYLNNLDLVFYLESNYDNNTEEVRYSNLNLNLYKPLAVISITPNEIKEVFSKAKINIDPTKNLNLSLTEINPDFDLLKYGIKNTSCSSLKPKFFEKKINEEKGFIEYSSEAGSSCDFFSFPNLPHNVGYLVVIETANLKGLPFRVCLANPYSKRCDVNLALPSKKEFGENVIIVPPMNDGGSGYNIHLDNVAVGKQKSINRLRKIKILPFPFNWLTNMEFSKMEGHSVNKTKVLETKEVFPNLFEIAYQNTNSLGLIQLNYIYDNGWVAMGKEHVKVNGWANGWLVKANEQGRIYIFYLPQFLEFLGFGLVIVTFLVISLTSSKFIVKQSSGK